MSKTTVKLFVLFVLIFSPLNIFSQFETIPTDAEIDARIADLNSEKNKIVSEDNFMLNDEMRRIDTEIASLRRFASSTDESPKTIQVLEGAKTQAVKAFGMLDSLNCSSPDAEKQISNIQTEFSSISRKIYRTTLSFDLSIENPWETLSIGRRPEQKTSDICQVFVELGKDTGKRQSLLAYFDTAHEEIVKTQTTESGRKEKINSLIKLLQERRTALQDKIRSISTKQEIGNNLWAVILVIGLLSIGTILVVKVFEHDLQIEWIASGQVIQFVTVMILLSVIMALGLSNILKENTLGTLLGGIAGYVLSQGVGRAAARAVTRRLDNESTKQSSTKKLSKRKNSNPASQNETTQTQTSQSVTTEDKTII
jgi:hypothetical protein